MRDGHHDTIQSYQNNWNKDRNQDK